MQENFSFRSAFNGFNRDDVINYIKKLFDEVENAKQLAAEKETEIESKNSEIASLQNKLDDAVKENEKLQKTIESKEKKDLQLNSKAIEEKYEAQLGSAMMDARRFADTLVQEANDKCSQLFDDASKSADNSSAVALSLASDIKKTMNDVTSSLNVLFDNLTLISKNLKEFSDNSQYESRTFDFSSEFTKDVAKDNENKIEESAVNIEEINNFLDYSKKMSEHYENI